MKRKFEKGDRVEYTGHAYIHIEGKTGTIMGSFYIGNNCCNKVKWKDFNKGHDCQGLLKDKSGWNVYAKDLRLSGIANENSGIIVKRS